jgi:hypothetical protein
MDGAEDPTGAKTEGRSAPEPMLMAHAGVGHSWTHVGVWSKASTECPTETCTPRLDPKEDCTNAERTGMLVITFFQDRELLR